MDLIRHLCRLGALFCVPLAGLACSGGDASFGLLYHQFPLTLAPGERTEALGPFYYFEIQEQTKTRAVPPLFSVEVNEDLDVKHFDILWKVATYDRFGKEYRYQLAQLINLAGGGTQSGTNVQRFSVFPVYFQQRSKIPEKNYTAVFPLYGTLKDRLFRDEIHFVMFPCYGQSRKKDVVTDNYLFPIFHLRHGDGLRGWQFWPLYGSEHKTLTTKTNQWGDIETVGAHTKHFALWPIYSSQHTGIGTREEARQQAVLPFFSAFHSAARDSTTIPWPIGLTHTKDRQKNYVEWGAPWPLIVFAHGAGKTTHRVFPFFSQSHNTNLVSNWYLWPVYKYNGLHADPVRRGRTRILLYLYSDVRVSNTETHASLRQVDFWPFFTWRRELDGRSRLQLVSPLEPIFPNNPGVQRNLSPLWSIWRSESNAKTGATSQSFLWNLYRHDATPQTRKTSCLFGLFQHRSGPEGKQWRVFYVPFTKSNKSPAAT